MLIRSEIANNAILYNVQGSTQVLKITRIPRIGCGLLKAPNILYEKGTKQNKTKQKKKKKKKKKKKTKKENTGPYNSSYP